MPGTPTLAILGGGQLGQMLALAAIPMGVRVCSLDPSAAAPAGSVSALTVGGLGDIESLRAVAEGVEVVTYEWEGIPAAAARRLEAEGWIVRPATAALAVSQDRIEEKTTCTALGIPVAPFTAVDTRADLAAAVTELGLPAVLKTRRGGYDGKGQRVIRVTEDIDDAWTALANADGLVLEAHVGFDRELSIIAVRGIDGDVRYWPLVENHHREGILRMSRAPAPGATIELTERAESYARTLLEHFEYVGVLAVELFQVGDTLLVNELAPRVHNSGHWTIEGSVTSQFENHIRAVLGWPLGATTTREPSIMINCIGTLPEPDRILGLPGVHLHRYDKDLRPGRKVGHVTVTASDHAKLDAALAAVRAELPTDIG